jgi:hypothetical protein
VLVGVLGLACGGESTRADGRDPSGGAGAGAGGFTGGAGGVGGRGAGAGGGAGIEVAPSGAGAGGAAGSEPEVPRCANPMPGPPNVPEGTPITCPNGSVSVTAACSDASATGFDGTLDGEPLHLDAAPDAVTPGTVSVSRRGCGGPLTFAVTFALGGSRTGDALTVHANATEDCVIQGVYLPKDGPVESVAVTLTLAAFEESFGPSVLVGELDVRGAAGGAAPASLHGTFTLVTAVVPCVG